MDEHIYVDLPTCPQISDCKTDPHVTEGYIEPQERQSVKGQSLPDTPEAAECKTEHPKYFILEPEKSQLHKAQPVSDDNKPRTENSEPSNYLITLPTVKETVCTHLSTIRDKWWLSLLTGVFVGGILIGLIVFGALDSKDTSQQDGVSRCSWSSWSLWTECYLLSSVGKQQRVKLYMGDNCKQNETREYRKCQDKIRQLNITFDRSTLFSTCFLSNDNTLLSNHYTDETQNGPDGNNRLQNYSGVIADTCVDDNTIIYFEIGYFYEINTLYDDATLVFEIGIAERQMIDNAPYVGDTAVKGWSFHLANCQVYDKICLSAKHSLEDQIIRPVSSNKPGTTMNGVFGVLINRERDEFSLISNNIVVGMFRAVTSNVKLCPVFGIYNAHKMVGALKIMNARNYSNFVQSQWL